jgi:hypothetical protein
MTDGYMERLAARSTSRYDELVRSYAAFRELRHTPDFKPGTPTPDVKDTSRRQVDEAIIARELQLRQHRFELTKRG